METDIENTAAPSVEVPRLVRADAPGIWQLTDNMGNQKTVEVVNDPWATTNDNRERLYVRGKGNGYWPVNSSIFDGWEWSCPNDKFSDAGRRSL